MSYWIFHAIILFGILGIDLTVDDFEFGPNHDKYWLFEIIIIPSFIIFSLHLLKLLYFKIEMGKNNWKEETLGIGVAIMIIQFILDLFFLVIIFRNGINYFIALVTISYLLIPLWAYLFGWYLYERLED